MIHEAYDKQRPAHSRCPFAAKSLTVFADFGTIFKLERTRGAGAPEVLRRETAEEEFRLRRNQPLNMAPSAPKDRYCQADFFEKVDFLGGPGK